MFDQTALEDLTLADEDFTQNEIYKAFALTNDLSCNLFRSSMNILKSLENVFTKIYDANGKDTVVYSRNKHIVFPTCIPINQFDYLNKTEFCYKDIPGFIYLGEKKVNVFLTNSLF